MNGRKGSFLHTCAYCGLSFYGRSEDFLCSADRTRKPNGKCLSCGARVKRRRWLCHACVKDRARMAHARWERRVRPSADKRSVAERETFLSLEDLGAHGT